MKYPPFIELNGQKYMSAKTAADVWSLKPATVSAYCKEGKICHAIKYLESRWYIPTEAVKPLSNSEVRRFLTLTLQLKNKPSLEIDWGVFPIKNPAIDVIYRHLVFLELIEEFNISDKKRIPYEVILTQKGFEFATSCKKGKVEDYSSTMKEWLPTVIGVAQLIAQVTQIAI